MTEPTGNNEESTGSKDPFAEMNGGGKEEPGRWSCLTVLGLLFLGCLIFVGGCAAIIFKF